MRYLGPLIFGIILAMTLGEIVATHVDNIIHQYTLEIGDLNNG